MTFVIRVARAVIAVCASSVLLVSAAAVEPRVVVVGSGIAGMTVAYRLHQKGVNVHVYEARGRVGGRVLSATIGGLPVELGGHNIVDGGDAENLFQLISELGLDLVTRSMPLNQSYFDGQQLFSLPHLLNAKKFDPLALQIKLTDLAMSAINMREILDGVIPEDDLLNRIFTTRLAAYEGAPVEKLSPWYTETLYHMMLGGLAAARPAEENMTHQITVSGGNSLLLKKMVESLGVNRMHLNSALTAVAPGPDNSLLLTFNGMLKVPADIIILTIPCPLYSSIAFDAAAIPADRVQAIGRVPYATNAKLLVPFLPSVVSASGDVVADGMVSAIDAQHGLATTYLTNERGLFSSQTIGSVYGEVRKMLETVLVDVAPPVADPVYAQDAEGMAYTGPVGYSWVNDPWARGSYSYVGAGYEIEFAMITEVAGEPVKALFAPIKNKIFFAGEHTSILMDVTGTMEAACESGERAARMVLKTVLE